MGLNVYIVQTNDCWPLAPLVAQLNNCQHVFRFTLADRNLTGQRLRINPTVNLREVARLSPADGRRRILQSYLTENDWADQTRRFLETCSGFEFDQNEDLAVAIGAGVYVLDDEGVTFQGNREADAYTCIYDYRTIENATVDTPNFGIGKPFDAFAAISAIRFEPVFGCRYQVASDKNRADRARYIVTNLAHFLATRAFWIPLAREHSGQSCVMETSWGGGDYLAGYYTNGICEACVDLLHSKVSGPIVSYRLRQHSERDVIQALDSLCRLPDTWDRYVRACNLLRGTMLPLFSSAIGLGLLTNLLAGFANSHGTTQTHELLEYIKEHRIALVVTGFSAFLAIVSLLILEVLRLSLP